MEFAQQQLRCAFDEIDYAVANESPESRAQRERTDGGHSPIPGIRNRTGRFTSSRQRLDQRILPPASSGFSMSIPRIISGKRRRSNIPISWNRKKMNGGTHDMGFKMYCSFGNGYRLTQDERYKKKFCCNRHAHFPPGSNPKPALSALGTITRINGNARSSLII